MVRRGLCHQEAPQAYGEEEAPQAAEQDASSSVATRSSDLPRVRSDLMTRVVLVTGVSRYLGGRFARALGDEPDVAPGHRRRRHPAAARHRRRPSSSAPTSATRSSPGCIADTGVDTVVHMNVIATPVSAGGRVVPEGDQRHRHHAAARGLPEGAVAASGWWSSRRPRSTAPRPRDPAMFTEDTGPKAMPRSRFRQGLGRGRGLRPRLLPASARRRGHRRCASPTSSGPASGPPLTDYFALPVVPIPFGYDPRIQFVHEDDAVEAMRLATRGSPVGVVNVAGDGVITLPSRRPG